MEAKELPFLSSNRDSPPAPRTGQPVWPSLGQMRPSPEAPNSSFSVTQGRQKWDIRKSSSFM